MKKEQIIKMIEIAFSQLAYSYTPYSDFKVGAALLGKNGRIYTCLLYTSDAADEH